MGVVASCSDRGGLAFCELAGELLTGWLGEHAFTVSVLDTKAIDPLLTDMFGDVIAMATVEFSKNMVELVNRHRIIQSEMPQ